MSKYQEMLTRIGELNGEVKTIFDNAGDEPLDTQTYEKVKDNNKEIERLEGMVKTYLDQVAAKQAAQKRDDDLNKPVNGLPTPQHSKNGKPEQKAAQLADQVLDDPEFKAWRERVAQNGVSSAQFGNSPAVQVKDLLTGASDTSAGSLVYPRFLGFQDAGTFMRPLTVRDLITTGTTDGDAVAYVRQTSLTNNAAPVAEATAASGGTGVKPESAFALAVINETVKTIAHWIPATRRALADAGQLRTLINSILMYGLDEELEDQILTGSGTGENFTGIMNTTGTSTQAYDTGLLVTTRKARTKVKTLGRANPTAYVMHPNDWEDFDLLVDAETRYYFGGPSVLGTPRLWGLPVVESEGMTEGFSIVADWRLAILWDRQRAQILTSDSHSDFFIRNLIAILAELRAAFGVIRPAAFVEIDLTA